MIRQFLQFQHVLKRNTKARRSETSKRLCLPHSLSRFRTFDVSWFCLLAAILTAACSTSPVPAAAAANGTSAPPNLLVIQTDEHHFNTLGCYGGRIVATPHIDWLAENGARATSFYATTPVCSPSRSSFVSGRYPQNTPVITNNVPMDDSVVTFAEILARQGYAAGYAGKWHLDGSGKPQWGPEREFGFSDNRFMFNRGHWKKMEDTPEGPRVASRNAKDQPDYGVAGADEKSFTTDWLAQKAIDFIDVHHGEPFCYMVSFPDPHGPNTVRPPYDTMYAGVEVPIPASLDKTEEQTPKWGRGEKGVGQVHRRQRGADLAVASRPRHPRKDHRRLHRRPRRPLRRARPPEQGRAV